MLFYLIFLALSGIACGCPDVMPDVKFNTSYYNRGKWYEVARYKYDLQESADCITYNFNEEGKLTIQEIKDKNLVRINGGVYPTHEPGKVLLHSDGSAVPDVPSIVLATDNTNYVIFYSCVDGDATKPDAEFSWIVSRTPTIDPELKSMIHKFIDETHILDKDKYRWDHLTPEDCMI